MERSEDGCFKPRDSGKNFLSAWATASEAAPLRISPGQRSFSSGWNNVVWGGHKAYGMGYSSHHHPSYHGQTNRQQAVSGTSPRNTAGREMRWLSRSPKQAGSPPSIPLNHHLPTDREISWRTSGSHRLFASSSLQAGEGASLAFLKTLSPFVDEKGSMPRKGKQLKSPATGIMLNWISNK